MSTDEIQIPEARDGDIWYSAHELDPASPRRAAILEASQAGRLTTSYYQRVKAVPGHERTTKDGTIWVQPHFSPVGKAIKPEAIDPIATERDGTHNKIVESLYETLNLYKSNFVIATNHLIKTEKVRREDGQPKDVLKPVKLWACPDGPNFVWQREPFTHRWFERVKYIQPDLVGFDANRPFPGPNNPTVIIEVINFHPPEEGTWERLVELSRNHHLVLFYLCAEGHTFGRYGKMKKRIKNTPNGPVKRLWLQVAFYLMDGIFYDEGKPKTSNNQTNAQQHDIVDKIFKRMKAKYFSGPKAESPLSQAVSDSSDGSVPTETEK